MTIPKTVQIGLTPYQIILVDTPLVAFLKEKYGEEDFTEDEYLYGMVMYSSRIIYLSTLDYHGNPLAESIIEDTFFHEVTHALLNSVKSQDSGDETIVQFLGERLNTFIKHLSKDLIK